MSYTDEFNKEAYFGDLCELTIEEAAEKIQAGLWDSDQATVADIKKAIIIDIQKGDLKLVRGSVNLIGKYNNNPPILNAFELALWAEKNGLELESNGAWDSYILDEAELTGELISKLETLRAIQRSGKTIEETLKIPEIKNESQEDELTRLYIENQELKSKLNNLTEDEQKPNPKAMNSIFILLSVMAAKGYGYEWTDKKSPIPNEIANDVAEILGITIKEDTVRKWLKIASEANPPQRQKPS